MPWTRTRAYPHAFAVPEHKRGGAYNYMTYTMFDQVFWRAIAGQVNRWRRKTMGIEATNFDKLEQHKGESRVDVVFTIFSQHPSESAG